MIDNFKNSFVYTVFFTFIISFIAVFILSFLNSIAVEKIAEREELERKIQILASMGFEEDSLSHSRQKVEELFSTIRIETKNETEYYVGQVDGETIYSTAFSGPGLWGIIKGYLATNTEVSRIVGMRISEQQETPGLGALISEEWFQEQLRGEKIVDNTIKVVGKGKGDANKDNGEIDAISGATFTSKAVQEILAKKINEFLLDFEKGGKKSDSPEIARKKIFLDVLGMGGAKDLSQEAIEQYYNNISQEEINAHTYYVLDVDGTKHYAGEFVAKGMHGDISVLIGVKPDLSTLTGFGVLRHEEQMGKDVESEWFRDQFKNEVLGDGILIMGAGQGDADKENGFVDGISSATKTSEAIQQILDNAVAQFKEDLQ